MGMIKPANKVIFANFELEKAFNSLAENSPLKKSIQKSIQKAINNLKRNIFCGQQIPKDRIPREYIQKYKINNLWWHPLTNNWRLVYSAVTPLNFEILAVIIEYFDHKNYERRFGY